MHKYIDSGTPTPLELLVRCPLSAVIGVIRDCLWRRPYGRVPLNVRDCTAVSTDPLLHLGILSVHTVHSHHVVAEVEGIKPFLLAQQCHDGAASPL